MMNGVDIGFSRARSPYAVGSTAIRLAEKRSFSHCFIRYIDPFTGRVMILQASHGMVHVVSERTFLAANVVVRTYRLDFTEDEFKKFWNFMLDVLGTKYSERQLVVIAFMKLVGLKKSIRVNGCAGFICSELGGRIARIKSIMVPKVLDTLTPSDLDFILDCAELPCTQVEA